MHIINLKVFCDLVDTSSFSGSAERNGITQSAVSQQIRSLEDRFGVVFFERGKKNFSITPEGVVFHEAAQKILSIHDGLASSLKAVRNEVGGKLRVATVYSIGLHELPPLVKNFRYRFTDVEVIIHYKRASDVYADVAEDKADIGLVAYPKARRGLSVETFARDRLVLICPPGHPLCKLPKVSWRQLERQSFISFEPDLPTRKAVDQLLKDHNITITQTMELDNIETVKRAVEIESGVSIVPFNSVKEEVTTGQLKALDMDGDLLWRPMGLIQRRGRTITPALREFVECLRAFGRANGAEGLGPLPDEEEG